MGGTVSVAQTVGKCKPHAPVCATPRRTSMLLSLLFSVGAQSCNACQYKLKLLRRPPNPVDWPLFSARARASPPQVLGLRYLGCESMPQARSLDVALCIERRRCWGWCCAEVPAPRRSANARAESVGTRRFRYQPPAGGTLRCLLVLRHWMLACSKQRVRWPNPASSVQGITAFPLLVWLTNGSQQAVGLSKSMVISDMEFKFKT